MGGGLVIDVLGQTFWILLQVDVHNARFLVDGENVAGVFADDATDETHRDQEAKLAKLQ